MTIPPRLPDTSSGFTGVAVAVAGDAVTVGDKVGVTVGGIGVIVAVGGFGVAVSSGVFGVTVGSGALVIVSGALV